MTNWDSLSKKEKVLAIASDTMGRFLYYDRKEDEDFRPGDIEEMIQTGEITVEEILSVFETALRK